MVYYTKADDTDIGNDVFSFMSQLSNIKYYMMRFYEQNVFMVNDVGVPDKKCLIPGHYDNWIYRKALN